MPKSKPKKQINQGSKYPNLRERIVGVLERGPFTLKQIAEEIGDNTPDPIVRYHLKKLEELGHVKYTAKSKTYTLTRKKVGTQLALVSSPVPKKAKVVGTVVERVGMSNEVLARQIASQILRMRNVNDMGAQMFTEMDISAIEELVRMLTKERA